MSGATGGRHRLVIVRHGATEWSRSGQHTGRTDLPLLDAGREAAAALAPRLTAGSWALVLTSPLRRAADTAALAGFPDAEVDDDLLEWDYGEYEGRTTADIREERPGWTVWDGPIPGGETLDEVATRTDRAISRARGAGGDVLAFAHGHVLRVLGARWCGLAPIVGRHLVLGPAHPCELGWEHESPAVLSWNEP